MGRFRFEKPFQAFSKCKMLTSKILNPESRIQYDRYVADYMFDIRDHRMYKNVDRSKIYPMICDFWARQGFYVGQVSPFYIQGQSYHQKIGLRREFDIRIDEHEGDVYINLTFRATITDEGLAGGAAATIIFWPAAIVGGAVSYTEYEKDARNLIGTFWMFVDDITHKKGTLRRPPEPEEEEKPQPESTQCEYCGAFIITTWVVCPYCGNPIEEEEEDEDEDYDDED